MYTERTRRTINVISDTLLVIVGGVIAMTSMIKEIYPLVIVGVLAMAIAMFNTRMTNKEDLDYEQREKMIKQLNLIQKETKQKRRTGKRK